jgi:hypothetical protein
MKILMASYWEAWGFGSVADPDWDPVRFLPKDLESGIRIRDDFFRIPEPRHFAGAGIANYKLIFKFCTV